MNPKIVKTIAWGAFAVVIVLGGCWQAQAQDAKGPYPSMAPLDQYLMDRNAEIALARSAAPEAISRDADVLVLGKHGYETAVKGKNGFVCLVERGWIPKFEYIVSRTKLSKSFNSNVFLISATARTAEGTTTTKSSTLTNGVDVAFS
ncbi:MAG: hypothetical protein ABSF85_00740 [Terriglobales bacterium]